MIVLTARSSACAQDDIGREIREIKEGNTNTLNSLNSLISLILLDMKKLWMGWLGNLVLEWCSSGADMKKLRTGCLVGAISC